MVFIKYKYSLKYNSVNYYGFVNFLMQWLRSSWPHVTRFWPQNGHQWWPVGSNPPDEKCGCWIWWIFMVYWWSCWQQIGLICLKLFVRFQKIYEELKFSPTRWRFSRPKNLKCFKNFKENQFRNVQRPLPVIVLTLYTLFDLFNTESNKFQTRILPHDVNLIRNTWLFNEFKIVISGVFSSHQF